LPLPQTKAMQIFQAACRQGHFRLTVHTLDAATAAGAASSASPSPGGMLQGAPSAASAAGDSGRATPSPERTSLDLSPSCSDAASLQMGAATALSLRWARRHLPLVAVALAAGVVVRVVVAPDNAHFLGFFPA
jgi:hypothetical protein